VFADPWFISLTNGSTIHCNLLFFNDTSKFKEENKNHLENIARLSDIFDEQRIYFIPNNKCL